MEREIKVSFYLKKNETNSDGRCPVMARLSVSQDETTFSAKMSVPVALWDSGRAGGKSAAAREINRQLDRIRASAFSIYKEQYSIRDNVTAEDVKCILLGMASGQQTLLRYFRAHNVNFDKRVGVNRAKTTASSYWISLNHLSDFLQKKYRLSDIPFSALDSSFIDKYNLYLRTEVRLSPSTINLYITRLNTIIRNALADGLITSDLFVGYEPERLKMKQKYLTGEELHRLMNTPFEKPRHYLIRDLFLFACYTGIPYRDMCLLEEEDLEVAEDGQMWIKTKRHKTHIDFEVPLLELPLHILEKYRDTAPNGKLFPMYCNSHLNRELKVIAQKCGINRNLVFHMGRHTFATEITLSQGVPLETVSRMLGHSRIETTKIYAKVTDDKIEKDTRNLNERIAERFNVVI